MQPSSIIILMIVIFIFGFGIFFYWLSLFFKSNLEKRESAMQRRMYELAILKELQDRIGYSLNIQNIIDVITGSLNQFIEHSAVSYMLIEPEKIIFKVHLEKSVSRQFVKEIKKRMLKSLAVLLNKKFKLNQIEEVIAGAILIEEVETPLQSYFNIPLVIGEKAVGILTVADTKPGRYQEEEMTILYKITRQASEAVTRLQEVVRIEQRKLNAMVESMAEGVVMTDRDYHLLVVNPAAKRVIDLEGKEEISIFDFIDNLGGKFDIRGKLEKSVKLNQILEIPEVLIKNHFYRIFVSPVKSGEEILGGVVIFHDITKEKEVEKMRDDFTSMMIHELRSPLDNIKKMAEYLMKNVADKNFTKDFQEFMPLVFENSSKMLELVNDLLAAAKIEADKLQIYPKPTDIKEVIDEKVKFFSAAGQEAKIKLAVVLAENLPLKVNFDSLKIGQVLNNLLANALKFTPAGETVTILAVNHKNGQDVNKEVKNLKVKWFLSAAEVKKITVSPDSIVVAVTNPGPGIATEKIPQLFSKFVQFQTSAKSEKGGTGLGLVIAQGIVKAHRGIIGVGSEEGEGATFYFTIPIKNSGSPLAEAA